MDLVSDYGMKHSKPRQAFSEAAKDLSTSQRN